MKPGSNAYSRVIDRLEFQIQAAVCIINAHLFLPDKNWRVGRFYDFSPFLLCLAYYAFSDEYISLGMVEKNHIQKSFMKRKLHFFTNCLYGMHIYIFHTWHVILSEKLYFMMSTLLTPLHDVIIIYMNESHIFIHIIHRSRYERRWKKSPPTTLKLRFLVITRQHAVNRPSICIYIN